jgi:hypothetical protein
MLESVRVTDGPARTAYVPAVPKAGTAANAEWNGTAERSTADKTIALSLAVSLSEILVLIVIRFFIFVSP